MDGAAEGHLVVEAAEPLAARVRVDCEGRHRLLQQLAGALAVLVTTLIIIIVIIARLACTGSGKDVLQAALPRHCPGQQPRHPGADMGSGPRPSDESGRANNWVAAVSRTRIVRPGSSVVTVAVAIAVASASCAVAAGRALAVLAQ